MKILQLHNLYQRPGGEDQVVAAERDLLVNRGHAVEQYQLHNDEIGTLPAWHVALKTLWNGAARRAIETLMAQFQPDIVHAHNTFPLISPSAYYAGAANHPPVIQTLHNFRLICPAATLYRDGRVCEDCLQAFAPYPGILHGCYRGSRGASAVTAGMLTAHRAAGTWTRRIHTYIALTNAAKLKFVQGGLPADKIVVKPNFLSEDPGAGSGDGCFALFLGRLSEEKGIRTLLSAWRQIPNLPLKIAGDGPLRDFVKDSIEDLPNVSWLGQQPHSDVLQLLKDALVLVFPSEWYEGQPLTLIESAACGTPVILSDLGSMGEWARVSGLAMPFTPGDAVGLAKQVEAFAAQPEGHAELRRRMREFYLAHYTPEQNYRQLLAIYRRAASQ